MIIWPITVDGVLLHSACKYEKVDHLFRNHTAIKLIKIMKMKTARKCTGMRFTNSVTFPLSLSPKLPSVWPGRDIAEI